MKLNENEKIIYDMINSYLLNKPSQTDEELDVIITQIAYMNVNLVSLSKTEIEHIKAKITSEHAIRLSPGVCIENEKHKKWFEFKKHELEMKYWERYKTFLLRHKRFQPDVINTMDEILDNLTDLLGDPESTEPFSRKGLILGDVQSGKTANYTGLMCKAADANYKVIILLTGTIEKLRQQTQQRIDEGFVGFDSNALISKKQANHIGVGIIKGTFRPFCLTSTSADFKKDIAININFDLNSINEPVVFVIKKNVTVLKRLNSWFRALHQQGNQKILFPMLLIDDEADNASVNVNNDDVDPTAINYQIRNLLNIFERSSYVGFTATPYANIFINPETPEKMEKEDLFPKNYIYALNAPSNYLGARNIFGEDADYGYLCNVFTENEELELESILPPWHKNGTKFDKIPKSLMESIETFLIANVIRDLRGDKDEHRTMLVNMSRFNSVQKVLGDLISEYLKEIQQVVKNHGGKTIDEGLKVSGIHRLYLAFQKYYRNTEVEWEKIYDNLYDSIRMINTAVINQNKNGQLNYDEYPKGLRIIVIGGLSLSRGLTLEGLMTSYFYRNSKMYDTLMQMGRWFGYRPNYLDLCRIWMTETSQLWYSHITEATDELREDIKRHQDSGLTPLEFGLKVRSDINTLLVTARNKMKKAITTTCTISLSEETIETPDIFINEHIINNNFIAARELIETIHENISASYDGNSIIYRNSPKGIILNFLDSILVPVTNETFDPKVLSRFINNYKGNELEKWDVVFVNGQHNEKYVIEPGYSINYKDGSFSMLKGNIVRMLGSKRRLGSSGDGRFGLVGISDKELSDRIQLITGKSKKQPRQKDYFTYEYIQMERNPQLIIYNFILGRAAKSATRFSQDDLDSHIGKKVIGFGIGIPKLRDNQTKYANYTLSVIAQQLQYEFDWEDDENND